jgi:uncharacterized protein YyaL (SSP411 family)
VANRLSGESSLYLRQHQHNPVDWYPWGDEAWERARREDKPVLVSIGYSSCHWCHVMERESFEDPEVAELMNAHLIAIKVDREERPDVDQIYMEAVMRLAGQGGWPLNMFCKPDGRPFHGGTYFPPRRMYGRPSWSDVVLAVARAYREQPGEVEELSQRLVESIGARPELPKAEAPGRRALEVLCRKLQQSADRTHGGFGGAPKFPTPTNLEAILAGRHLGVSDGGAFEQLCFTLGAMARGGIFDQLGGGFHRYSTDARWLVPHFEKMLYDNGQLLRVYANAYRLTGDPDLRWPVAETAAWLEREMLGPSGEAYASQDADSEGEEGRYFVWSPEAIASVLGASGGEAFCAAYRVTAQGNFEGTNQSVLSQAPEVERVAFAAERAKLLTARAGRIPPATDTKCIAAWQGYALGGLAAAGSAFGAPAWIELARRLADFALVRLSDEGNGLLRIWDGERARIPGFLDDHAALLCALCDLFRADPQPRWIRAALRLAQAIAGEFYDPQARDLFFARGADRTLVVRPASDSDGATPGGAGLAVLGLVRVAALCGRAELRDVARAVLDTHAGIAERVPLHLPTLVRAGALDDAGIGVGLVIGDPSDPRSEALLARARALLAPDDFALALAPGERPEWLDPSWLEGRDAMDGRPTAYLCRGTTCSLPAHTPESLALPPVA